MSNKITRRNLLRGAAVGAIALSTMQTTSFAQTTKAAPKILVLGGGYGGSAVSKYLKLFDPSLDVTMIDMNDTHTSCAMSNEVIFGLAPMSKIVLKHTVIVKKYGVKFVKAKVLSLDAEKKTVKTSNGDFKYDKLIVSPGIGYIYDEKAGFTKAMQEDAVASWIAGPQTLQLKKQLDSLKKGGTVLLRIPKALYRCPPGPYERACLMAERAKKLGGKLVVLDSNKGIVSKAPLFKVAFEELYKDTLTYIPDTEITGYDLKTRSLITSKGKFTADVINYIPDQRAADMAFDLGLVPDGLNWAPIKASTFESTVFKDVYVIGDAIYTEPISVQPKSGTIANNMGQMLAQNLALELSGKEVLPPFLGNSCYSHVSSTEAIWIATVYSYNSATDKIEIKDGANGIAEKASVENKRNLDSWATNILADTFS